MYLYAYVLKHYVRIKWNCFETRCLQNLCHFSDENYQPQIISLHPKYKEKEKKNNQRSRNWKQKFCVSFLFFFCTPWKENTTIRAKEEKLFRIRTTCFLMGKWGLPYVKDVSIIRANCRIQYQKIFAETDDLTFVTLTMPLYCNILMLTKWILYK